MLHRAFQTYGHYKGPLDKVRKGVLISMAGLPLFACCLYFCQEKGHHQPIVSQATVLLSNHPIPQGNTLSYVRSFTGLLIHDSAVCLATLACMAGLCLSFCNYSMLCSEAQL